jgi:GMP synthase (glutamine-hydrolysing)
VETADAGRVLVVQHEPGAPAGWFGDALQEHGCRLTVAAPYDGAPLPGLDGFAGLLVLGGAVDAWDDGAAPWLPGTRELVRRAERDGVPTLGICLGHQIAAHALGGEPGRNPAGRTVSIQPVGWAPDAASDPLFASARSAERAVHWNRDVVLSLPDGATTVAVSKDGAVQASRLGRHVWGIQSHPEVDAAILVAWLAEDWEDSDSADREVMTALVHDVRREEQSLRQSWWPLAQTFARLVREGLRDR